METTSIELARARHVDSLFKPRAYRPGKMSGIGQGKTQRETLLDIRGPGVFRRLWTTHGNADRVKLHVFVDGSDEPVLSGFAHKLAEAAANIRCPLIPLGGYLQNKSVNLYLPIRFEKSLRIEAEPEDDAGDGPYWQIDYSLNDPEQWPMPRQETLNGKIRISYDLPDVPAPVAARKLEAVEQTFGLAQASPHNIWLEGGGVIRRLEIESATLDSLLLRIAFDPSPGADGRMDGPFQVDAPLRYMVGQFDNACVQRLGSKAVIHFPMPFLDRAGIQITAGMEYGSFSQRHDVRVRVEYEKLPPDMEEAYCFHARFHCEVSRGYDGVECLSTRGRGHFVGVNIFDTGHDHGGGDSIFFDAGADTAGQLHGICGEDYFHMAYMDVGNRTPYSGCPTHAARYRHHIEMPIPFEESFVFNWGAFAGQPAKSVAFWYQDKPAAPEDRPGLVYTLTGPFPIKLIDGLAPGNPMPDEALVWHWGEGTRRSRQSWRKSAQQGFVDLCHVNRKYIWQYPAASGCLIGDVCVCADASVWAAREADAVLRVGCDDPVRVYLNGELVLSDDGRNEPDPFRVFKAQARLREGMNDIRVVAGNLGNYNWFWYGFSLALDSALAENELRFAQ